MHYLIHEVFDVYGSTPLNYLLQRMPLAHLTGIHSYRQLDEICYNHIKKKIPTVHKDHHPAFTSKTATVELLMESARNRIHGEHRKVPGEIVVSEAFTYLSEPYAGYETGTAVLKLRTNYAMIYCFFSNHHVDEQGVHKRHPPKSAHHKAQKNSGKDDD